MLERLILYRNDLKGSPIYTYKLLGIVSELLFSKEIFPRNKDIKLFLIEIFSIEYKDYVMKSRTLIVARVCKFIYSLEERNSTIKKLSKFISNKIDELKTKDKKEISDMLNGWIK